MEVDERPTEEYADIGGLDKQIQELVEAVVLPITHKVGKLRQWACLLTPHVGAFRGTGCEATEGSAHVWPSRHWKDPHGSRLCRAD